MNVRLTWETGLALWALDLLRSGQVIELAVLALERSIDSRAIRHLAGLLDDSGEDLKPEFSDALRELKIGIPTRTEAARTLARFLSCELIQDRADAFETARMIGLISVAVEEDEFHDLDAFIYAESEAESRPADRGFFRELILREARKWAAS
jgi:hypothetical protein